VRAPCTLMTAGGLHATHAHLPPLLFKRLAFAARSRVTCTRCGKCFAGHALGSPVSATWFAYPDEPCNTWCGGFYPSRLPCKILSARVRTRQTLMQHSIPHRRMCATRCNP
jgi:hypothetical protein